MPKKRPAQKSIELTRPGLLRKYRISDRTFRMITDAARLCDPKSTVSHGKARYEITPEIDKILSIARICPYSFSGFRPPCYRFIALCALTGDMEDCLYGLKDRWLNARSLSLEVLVDLQSKILSVFPKPMQERLRNGLPPTKPQEKLFRTALMVTSLVVPYDSPEYVDQLYFSEERLTHFVNQVLWTHSCSEDRRAALINEVAGCDVITAEGLMWYRALFHDHEYMRTEDVNFYLSGLAPALKRGYKEALEMSTEDLACKIRLIDDDLAVMRYAARKIKDRLVRSLSSLNIETFNEARKDIIAFKNMHDAITKLRPDDRKEPPGYLRDITVEERDYDEYFTDITQVTDGEEAG